MTDRDKWAGTEPEGIEWDLTPISGVWRCMLCGESGVVVHIRGQQMKTHRSLTRLAGLGHYDSNHQRCMAPGCTNGCAPRTKTFKATKTCVIHRDGHGGFQPGGKKWSAAE